MKYDVRLCFSGVRHSAWRENNALIHHFVLRFYDSCKASADCKSGTGTLSSILESEVVVH